MVVATAAGSLNTMMSPVTSNVWSARRPALLHACPRAFDRRSVGAYFRTHKPVVVLPGGHARPSGAPVEQTTETRTSFSLHRTEPFDPVTMRSAG